MIFKLERCHDFVECALSRGNALEDTLTSLVESLSTEREEGVSSANTAYELDWEKLVLYKRDDRDVVKGNIETLVRESDGRKQSINIVVDELQSKF